MREFQQIILLQCDYARIQMALAELGQMLTAQDALILLEDAVFALHHPQIAQRSELFVLHSDAHLIPDSLSNTVQLIDYEQLADMLSQATKVITWK